MSTRPVVTYAGDIQLFMSLESLLLQGIPQETVEWKRTYGRPPRAVTLSCSFEALNTNNQGAKDASRSFSRLSGSQVLHTYWVECPDIDTYKASLKENIQVWFSSLKQLEFQDWLIILVENSDSKKSNKILPRTTVLDKVKSDFGGKTTERCLSVLDPGKGEPKSSESWQTFLFRIRQALMSAFSRALTKFEEVVRTEREHRNEPHWNFCNYFLLQEELAFVFEMLGLYDDALVQYDELDALFTQFVLNSSIGDIPNWLSSFQISPNDWSGVCLNSNCSFNSELRNKIEKYRMSAIDFRNYLFSRQSALLLVAFKPAEVARRCLPYVLNCVHELKLLNVQVVDGGIQSWVLLTCLNVLATCQACMVSSANHQAMEYFALLWNISKDKLYELGRMCGLLPGANMGSAELHCMATLASGIVDCHEVSISHPAPTQKFKEALSSKEAFTRHYLELSELAMGTFKHCGRLRSARLIGKDLARFYIQLDQPQKAVNFLLELLRGYEEENWPELKSMTHIDLAEVYHKIGDHDKFIRASASIAAYKNLDHELRMQYYHNLFRTSSENVTTLGCSEMVSVSSIDVEYEPNLDPRSVIFDMEIKATMEVVSNLPGPLTCKEIRVSVIPVKSHTDDKSNVKKNDNAFEPEDKMCEAGYKPWTFLSSSLQMREQQHFKQDGSLSSVALVCHNSHKVLGRQNSRGSRLNEAVVQKSEYPQYFSAENVTLVPGVNNITLVIKAETEGTFTVNQFCIRSSSLEFVDNLRGKTPSFTVVKVTPSVNIARSKEDLLAGIEQNVQLIIKSGSTPFAMEAKLRLLTSRGLSVRLASDQNFQRELDLQLRPMAAFTSITFDLMLMAELTFLKDATSVEHKLSLQCPWLSKAPPLTDLPLHFSAPFTVVNRLHTAHTKKYINVHIQGLTPIHRAFELSSPNLQLSEMNFKNPGLSNLELKSVNGVDKILTLSQERSCNFLWELIGSISETLPPLKIEFSIQFRANVDTDWRKHIYNFEIADYQTLFTVRSRVEPLKGSDFLRVGSLCHMTLTVGAIQQQNVCTTALMYEVLADQALWAVCGRTAGVVSMEGTNKHVVTLDVMPLVCGFLPLPAVRLSKYIPADQKPKDGNRKPDLGLSSPTLPRLEPFSPGQVYNWSKAQQVHVLAAPSNISGISLDNSLS